MTFLNAPWHVEREPLCLVVVDSRNQIVAQFSLESEDLPGTVANEEEKAYGLAGLPEVHAAAAEFMAALSDPVRCLDENDLLACSDKLEAALLKSKPPVPA